jgi:hypothetical protein
MAKLDDQKTGRIIYSVQSILSSFGIKDLEVIGKIDVLSDKRYFKLRTIETRQTWKLSELCVKSTDLGQDVRSCCQVMERVDFDINVFEEGQRIGYIDSDCRFLFEAAPDLRTCVGWAVATDVGHSERSPLDPFHYDLDQAVERITSLLGTSPLPEGSLKEFFFRTFQPMVSEIMAWNKGSRYGGGYCTWGPLYWEVGTRLLWGKSHPGFPILC